MRSRIRQQNELVSGRTLAVVSSSLEAGGSGTDNATVFAENSPTLVRLQ